MHKTSLSWGSDILPIETNTATASPGAPSVLALMPAVVTAAVFVIVQRANATLPIKEQQRQLFHDD
jgi:hypothetical protein